MNNYSLILDINFSSHNITQLVVLIVFLICSAFFSSSETAFSMVNRVRMQTLAEDGNKKATLVLKILDRYPKMLSTVLVGNNIVNIGASSIATLMATDIFGSWAVGIVTGVLTAVVLVFGEIVPKTSAAVSAEKITLAFAPIVNFLMLVLTPIVMIIDFIAGGILKLMRVDPNARHPAITERELLSYVDASHDEGVIDSEEHEMIHNMFDFSDAVVKDIMVPRVNMVAISKDATFEETRALVRDNMYTRIPVYDGNPDTIVGVLNIKDLLFLDDSSEFSVASLMRECMYTHEFKKVSQLLEEMLDSNAPLAIVLNEYGTAEGIITLEDLIEEIIGEINDEYDSPADTPIRRIGEGDYIIDGSTSLVDVNDALGTEIDSEDFDSIGGIVIDHTAGRLPKVGDTVTLEDGTRIRVAKIEGNRIATVRVFLENPKKEDS